MLILERFINELMTSNCYIVWDDETLAAICIDPGSEYSLKEIEYIDRNGLHLDYIILSHEHTDHSWGVNSLLDRYDAKVICSEKCKENLPYAGNAYFRLYYEREDYSYAVRQVDITAESLNYSLNWNNTKVKFIPSPGHSLGSICIDIDGILFTGDTIMQYKGYVNKKNGDARLYKQSVQFIMDSYPLDTVVYPGHGEHFLLKNKDNIIK